MWKCFHCGEVFNDSRSAAQHFGRDETRTAACKLTASEGHLISYIRKLEGELESYRNEDGQILRAMLTQQAEHRDAVRRAEERGYDRGVQEAKRMFENEGVQGG